MSHAVEVAFPDATRTRATRAALVGLRLRPVFSAVPVSISRRSRWPCRASSRFLRYMPARRYAVPVDRRRWRSPGTRCPPSSTRRVVGGDRSPVDGQLPLAVPLGLVDLEHRSVEPARVLEPGRSSPTPLDSSGHAPGGSCRRTRTPWLRTRRTPSRPTARPPCRPSPRCRRSARSRRAASTPPPWCGGEVARRPCPRGRDSRRLPRRRLPRGGGVSPAPGAAWTPSDPSTARSFGPSAMTAPSRRCAPDVHEAAELNARPALRASCRPYRQALRLAPRVAIPHAEPARPQGRRLARHSARWSRPDRPAWPSDTPGSGKFRPGSGGRGPPLTCRFARSRRSSAG